MSTSLVHVLTIVGTSAEEIEVVCDRLLSRRMNCEPGYGSSNWSEQDRREIDEVSVTLIHAARTLPVVYYAQYIDGWSVASSMFWHLPSPDGKARVVYGSTFDLTYYPSRFAESLLAGIKRKRRTRFYRTQSEDRWYLDHVKEAIESALWLNAEYLVVSISECLGPSRYDEELKACLKSSIRLPNGHAS